MNQFAHDVLEGLQSQPKHLSSKYFYDEKGDELFQRIMSLDEYYLTRTEFDILDTHKGAILESFRKSTQRFNLNEFGAGDGYKTKILLRYFLEQNEDFTYLPIDISSNVLNILETALKSEMPNLQVSGLQNDYFMALSELKQSPDRNVVLFLGSNIGNFTGDQAIDFLKKLGQSLKKDDLLFIGFDLKKEPRVILEAYNDGDGVTKAFNLNLLTRINQELGGNFDLAKFQHAPIYNPLTGTTSSFLVSTERQIVEIMDAAIQFDAWEAIHMEISQKYDQKMIQNLAADSGFEITDSFTDDKNYFLNSIWRKLSQE